MLTCYDYSFAKILDKAELDIILVGDSLANVVLGLKETRKVALREMINHTQAVAKGVNRALVVADMPYVAYQQNPKKCVEYAVKFMKAGAQAVKIEWFSRCIEVVKRLRKADIPVIGHIGLTPQTVHILGGYKVQGRDEKAALKLLDQAKKIQDAGAFSIILECVPFSLAGRITKELSIPTVGIGAGKYCDGQVLVLYDFLGLSGKKLKFARPYLNFSDKIQKAIIKFKQDVQEGDFPAFEESFS